MKLYTVEPKTKPQWMEVVPPSYRTVVGLERNDTRLVLSDAPYNFSVEEFDVPTEFGDGIALCFEYFYVQKPEVYRNCHMGALAMTRCRISSELQAYTLASKLVNGQEPGELPVLTGKWAVRGTHPPKPFARLVQHSIVGLSPETFIQIDEAGASMGLGNYPDVNHHHYYVQQ